MPTLSSDHPASSAPVVLRAAPSRVPAEPAFVVRSPAMREMLERAQLFARASATVLIEGASGTGKSYVAQYIHLASSRARAEFRWVNTPAMEDSLAGSELFGHARGAFTGASSQRAGYLASTNGGTVFLDEIGKASRAVQAKLLHVIEQREFCALGEDRPRVVDVRFLAAASEGLGRLVAAGTFLADLLERLRGFRVVVPSLCERREDIPDLVGQFAWAHAAQAGYDGGPPDFEAGVMRAMTRAPWQGNLRELSTTVHLLLVYARRAPTVTLAHCRGDVEYLADLGRQRPRKEDAVLAEALERAGGNKSSAARIAGVSRSTIIRRVRKRDADEPPGAGPPMSPRPANPT